MVCSFRSRDFRTQHPPKVWFTINWCGPIQISKYIRNIRSYFWKFFLVVAISSLCENTDETGSLCNFSYWSHGLLTYKNVLNLFRFFTVDWNQVSTLFKLLFCKLQWEIHRNMGSTWSAFGKRNDKLLITGDHFGAQRKICAHSHLLLIVVHIHHIRMKFQMRRCGRRENKLRPGVFLHYHCNYWYLCRVLELQSRPIFLY